MHTSRLLTFASYLLLVACGCERRGLVVIADGWERGFEKTSFLHVIGDTLLASGVPDVRLDAWALALPSTRQSDQSLSEEYAANPDVVAVVGHAGSKGTQLALPAYRAAGIPVVVPTATSRRLRDTGAKVFLMSPSDDVVGAFLADAALDSLNSKRIAVAYVADAYGTGMRDGIAEQLGRRGLALAGTMAFSGTECGDVDPLAARADVRALLARAQPDLLIVVLSTTQAACVVREVRLVRRDLPIVLSDAFEPRRPQAQALTAAERANVRYLTFWEPDSSKASREFVRRVRARLGREPTAADALTMDAYMVVMEAIRAGNRTRASVAQWLSQLGTEGRPAHPGLTGPVDFRAPRRGVLRLRPLFEGSLP